ncbi:hypothetical protein VB713_26560 [Anabaena cylindrica UHCC 0172]|uniref:hypothetical protein n=1 Tax=Anabaena cylindrica TaxID=1165 RepID=UPI002B1FE87F|nr:hypothetical protein [Anabaena cylindrica]MEA5554500.1 hypothetical protein [Anabaena cylindrica UHCC 0172]
MSTFFNFYPNTLYLHSSSNPNVINSLIAKGIYALDQYVRQDIYDGCIRNERDYVSTLMSYTRLFFRNVKVVKNFYHCQSQILSNNLEQEFGCDALILFRSAGNTAKLCLFEAKYPRLNQINYRWDEYQTKNRYSHFHDQLTRQNNWSSSAFIWELFINDNLPGHSIKGFDKYGSTCVWHEDAYKYSETNLTHPCNGYYNQLWNKNKLKECVEQLPYNPLNLEDILTAILRSSVKEKLIPIKEEMIKIKSSEGKTIDIPASVNMIREIQNNFFETTGISNFLFIEFEDILSEIITETGKDINIDEIEF